MFATNAESVNVWKEAEKGLFVFDHTEHIRKGTTDENYKPPRVTKKEAENAKN